MTVPRKRKRLFGRPRYIAALAVGAVLVVALQVAVLSDVGIDDFQHRWLGLGMNGSAGAAMLAVRACVYLIGLCGLWMGRAWARLAGMGYLGAELAAFLLFGAVDWRGFFSLHILLVPYATFCLMYLQRDAGEYH